MKVTEGDIASAGGAPTARLALISCGCGDTVVVRSFFWGEEGRGGIKRKRGTIILSSHHYRFLCSFLWEQDTNCSVCPSSSRDKRQITLGSPMNHARPQIPSLWSLGCLLVQKAICFIADTAGRAESCLLACFIVIVGMRLTEISAYLGPLLPLGNSS